jgi:hypothetical protein
MYNFQGAFQKVVKNFKNKDKNTILITVALIAIIITAGLIFASSNKGFSFPTIFGKSDQEVAKEVLSYINSNNLAGQGVTAKMVSATEASGLVKIKLSINGNEFDSYATKDGKLLFPQAIPMAGDKSGSSQSSSSSASQAPVSKTDSPILEAYVVARCPYGLQMQRAMAEAVKNIPTLAQYLKVRYLGSVSGNKLVSMHGDAEAAENLRQICIRDEQPAKYWDYVACQMKTGDTGGCEKSTGVDSGKLSGCVSDPKRGIADAQKDFALDTKYNVQGSPTLVLNSATIDETGYGGRSADGVKSMVCAGFKNKPSFCNTKLSTVAAAVSFSATYSSSNSGTGNSGAGGANCAPAQ